MSTIKNHEQVHEQDRKQEKQDQQQVKPSIETNSESRHHDYSGLQAEQFIACPQKTVIPSNYNSAISKPENVRDATMSLYNSLNATDHI